MHLEGGATDISKRSSKHVRVLKEETPGLHARLAVLANRDPKTMESAKVIRYQDGEQFECHSDVQLGSRDDLFALPGQESKMTSFVNREITCFIYLNDVAEGGETAFWEERGSRVVPLTRKGDYSTAHTVIKPEKGLMVLFYPCLNPPSGVLPEVENSAGQYIFPKEKSFAAEGMWHAGTFNRS